MTEVTEKTVEMVKHLSKKLNNAEHNICNGSSTVYNLIKFDVSSLVVTNCIDVFCQKFKQLSKAYVL